MKKLYVMIFIVVLSALTLAGGVLSFIPQNANFVINFKNNVQNYDALKKTELFSFLLNDLGIENLIQASVSQTAVSMGTKASQIWSMTENDFVIFGDVSIQESQANFEIALKGKSKVLIDLLNALVGGNISSESVDGLEVKTFKTNGITVYATDHDGYVLVSNSPTLLSKSIQTYNGKNRAFTFTKKIPSDAWFGFYIKNDLTKDSTLDMVPVDGYGYAQVESGMLKITGMSEFSYKSKDLKSKLLSFKPDAKSLQDKPATGDMWISGDVADPVEFYTLLKEYAKDFGIKKEDISNLEREELIGYLSGKVFMNMNLSSDNANYVATIYLSKDMSKYIPDLSKEASATFTWKGHTVLRDDTVEGTTTTHTFTIFYPDKVVITDMEPTQAESFVSSTRKAKEVGNFSSFSNMIWNKSFLIGYVDIGSLVKSTLQYPLTSGAVFQMKFDENANLVWQLMIK